MPRDASACPARRTVAASPLAAAAAPSSTASTSSPSVASGSGSSSSSISASFSSMCPISSTGTPATTVPSGGKGVWAPTPPVRSSTYRLLVAARMREMSRSSRCASLSAARPASPLSCELWTRATTSSCRLSSESCDTRRSSSVNRRVPGKAASSARQIDSSTPRKEGAFVTTGCSTEATTAGCRVAAGRCRCCWPSATACDTISTAVGSDFPRVLANASRSRLICSRMATRRSSSSLRRWARWALVSSGGGASGAPGLGRRTPAERPAAVAPDVAVALPRLGARFVAPTPPAAAPPGVPGLAVRALGAAGGAAEIPDFGRPAAGGAICPLVSAFKPGGASRMTVCENSSMIASGSRNCSMRDLTNGICRISCTRGRSSGFFRRSFKASALVSSQKSPSTGLGSPLQIRITRAGIVFAVNGGCSTQSSYRMAPNDQMSPFSLYSLPSHSSGAR
mmetsp:Transcript_17058/g.43803  ORF Transcript_17058/g.43803 Transcript_17058/m.43803 type:complete len:453 (+) Transcript_17058:1166-2524(+)